MQNSESFTLCFKPQQEPGTALRMKLGKQATANEQNGAPPTTHWRKKPDNRAGNEETGK